jgi:retron-type reverse transcriptase
MVRIPDAGYTGKKEEAPLLMIASLADFKSASEFFEYLGVGNDERKFIEGYADFRYKEVPISKRRGGKRILLIPEPRLKFLQRIVLKLLYPLYTFRMPVHGFVPGRGVISNANAHQKRNYVLNLDIDNYFGSISRRRIVGLFRALGFEPDLTSALCAICVTRNQLPQGAPTSPLLANMITYRLDRDIMTFAKLHRLRYTRYADDITLSSHVPPLALFRSNTLVDGKLILEQLSDELRFVFLSNGFNINSRKIWFAGPRFRKEVTGLIVNDFTNVKRKFIRDLRATLHKIETIGIAAAQKEYEEKYGGTRSLETVVRGKIEWISQVRGRNFSAYRTLAKSFNRLYPNIALKIDPTYQEVAENAIWVVEYFSSDGNAYQGTAFFLKDVGLITADHVLDGLPTDEKAILYRPQEPEKRFHASRSKIRDTHRDIVILDHNIPEDSYLSLSQSTSPHQTDDEIVAMGFPAFGPGDPLGKRRGYINGRGVRNGVQTIEISSMIEGGMSGGPVINARYEVIGMAYRGGFGEPKQLAIDVLEIMELLKIHSKVLSSASKSS